MSLKELDIIWESNHRLKAGIDKIKTYISETELENGNNIDPDHASSLINMPKGELIWILDKGTEKGLFKKIYKYYCGDHKIGESEELSENFETFCDQCGETHEFTERDIKIGYTILFQTESSRMKMINFEDLENVHIHFGIITALPEEYFYCRFMLENPKEIKMPGKGAGKRYSLGYISSLDGSKHTVVLALTSGMGNSMASVRATLLLQHFPTVESVIMVGIAGGVPNPEKVEEHVRLGDIVISNEKGIIQYDFVKETSSGKIHRHSPRPPSARLLESVQLLKVDEIGGKRPWITNIDYALKNLEIDRPSEDIDILTSSTDPEIEIPHPKDANRIEGQPRVFTGPIAASNTLLKNPIIRDSLRENFGVKAVEMEGSGIADATWIHEVGYLVVRGICDYCDENKNDDWHNYAALVAAAYTKALLENIPSIDL